MKEIIRFQIDKWWKNIIVRYVWDQLRVCWIDTYHESFDLIASNANKQFIVREFKQYATNMNIRINIVFVEIHHSIEMIKWYHESFRRIYAIIVAKLLEIDSNSILQMTFKTLNDSINLNDLIFTLLVFDGYLRMIEMNVSSSTITQRFIAMRRTMNEVRKLNVTRQLNCYVITCKRRHSSSRNRSKKLISFPFRLLSFRASWRQVRHAFVVCYSHRIIHKTRW